jgi:hypothetical protein
MVMRNTFKRGHTLIFDYMYCRSERSRGLAEYSPPVVKCHETFARQKYESSQAKVVMMYGEKLQDRFMSNSNYDFTLLPLWDTLGGHFIALDHGKNYQNTDERFRMRRILDFAAHPQRLFYEPVGSELSKRQDVITLIATRMAATDLEY